MVTDYCNSFHFLFPSKYQQQWESHHQCTIPTHPQWTCGKQEPLASGTLDVTMALAACDLIQTHYLPADLRLGLSHNTNLYLYTILLHSVRVFSYQLPIPSGKNQQSSQSAKLLLGEGFGKNPISCCWLRRHEVWDTSGEKVVPNKGLLNDHGSSWNKEYLKTQDPNLHLRHHHHHHDHHHHHQIMS